MTRLIQLSGAVADLIYRVEAVPLPGQEAIVHGFQMAAGGGFNAMAAARRFGLDVAYGGTLGTGPFATMVARALHDEGITLLRPGSLKAQDQGACVVLIDRHGERSFIASEGADGVVTDADLAMLDPGPQDWFLLSGYALGYRASRDALTRWLERQHDLSLVFDPSPLVAAIPARSLEAALSAALWISANTEEAAFLTGLSSPPAAAAALAATRPKAGGAVVRDGANGCFMAEKGGHARHVPGHLVRPVDTNGAGDAHIGTFIAALAQGNPPDTAARLANVSAALSTTREGPATAPSKSAVLDALDDGNPIQHQRRRP